ncbi:MAG: tRNA 2-thiouridine(34) synthase MnmA [Phycisphaerales bacterium]
MATARRKVLVAMSGGVDSSVAAVLLKDQGHEVVGCFMRLGSPGETLDELPAHDAKPGLKIGHQGCCSINDAADARQVAAELGIPLYVCNFKNDFGRIIDYFVDEYSRGRTPNPCVRCNDWLKFGKLHEYAKNMGADMVASGHYARIERINGEPRMLRGFDESKDQSYVLFGVHREQLEHMAFPVGGMPKTEVRELAKQYGLPVFDKPDSQEICFVPDNDYAGLVERRRPELARKGEIVDESGRVLGEHGGQHRFTIGQRRGISVSLGHPIYVVAKDAAANRVVVGERDRLAVAECTAAEANWLVDAPGPGERLEVWAKYRYNTKAARAKVETLPDGSGPTPSGRHGRFLVRFSEPQQAVAAGQALVLYDDAGAVLGGGWIES